MNLRKSDIEPAVIVTPTVEAAMVKLAPRLHNGTYTVSSTKSGRHFTARLSTVKSGKLVGNRIFSMLTGPNNEVDFQGVAFWSESRGVINTWRRYQLPVGTFPSPRHLIDGHRIVSDSWSPIEHKLAILLNLAMYGSTEEQHGEAYRAGFRLQLASRCVKCNRTLTEPTSLRLGVGPYCAIKTERSSIQ